MKITIAYVYKWTNIVSNKWYIGSRTKIGCNPNDGYVCSSRKLKPLITESPNDWKRELICIGHPEDMLALETALLRTLDAAHDPMSYNMHNGDGKFTTAGKEPWNKGLKQPTGRPAWNSGKKCPTISNGRKGIPAHNKGKAMSEEQRQKMIAIHNNRSLETCKRISEGLKGRKHTEEELRKMSATMSGRKQSPEHIAKRAAARRAFYANKKGA